MALDSNNPDFYKDRAKVYEKLGQHDKVQADIAMAAKIKGKP